MGLIGMFRYLRQESEICHSARDADDGPVHPNPYMTITLLDMSFHPPDSIQIV